MGNLEILTEEGKSAFKPGEEIRGMAKWGFDYSPPSIELSLFWRTEGKGIQDAGIAQTIVFDNPGPSGRKDFKIIAPAGPYSFSGKLILINWALELAATNGKDAIRKEITISPTGQKIVCDDSIPDSDKMDAKGFLGKWAEQVKPNTGEK